MSEMDHLIIDEQVWEDLIELTGGAALICYQCGTCTANCPWGLVSEETVSVRQMIRQAQIGLPLTKDNLWLCTTCSYCEAYCPRGVDISDVILGLRQIAWQNRKIPAGTPSVLWSVYWNNNPWSQPPSQRSIWAAKLDLPYFDPGQHEILLYIGCTSSYDRRAQSIARALIHLLRAAKVSFGVLADDEPCCGETVLSLGHKHYFQEVSNRAATLFNDKGVESLVTISPHCYDAFRNHNQYLNQHIEVWHYTSYLADLIESHRLSFDRSQDVTVTFHDPCYLSRRNKESQAPRTILNAIPGLTIREMDRNGENTLCCGAGGGRMWMETESGRRFSDLRINEAEATGAAVLATSCPFCLTCLEDSVKGARNKDLTVKDVAEIAAEACLMPLD